MKAGDIIFVRGSSPLSKLVRFFDEGRFSHVAIAVSDKHVFEANWYIKATIREFHFKDYEIVDLGLTDEERKIITTESFSLIGKWYDFNQIIWYMVMRFLNIKGSNIFNSPNMLICSEAIYDLLKKVRKSHLVEGLSIDVTPNKLYDHITSKLSE
jgi:hypothetical protein